MKGTRVVWSDERLLEPGEYAKHPDDGTWYGCTPDDRLAWLKAHSVTEHDDGTISVSPSILVSGGGQRGSWHGYLERGVWREC